MPPSALRAIRSVGLADVVLGILAAVAFVTGPESGWPLILVLATVHVCVGWGLLGCIKGERSVARALIVTAPLGYAMFSSLWTPPSGCPASSGAPCRDLVDRVRLDICRRVDLGCLRRQPTHRIRGCVDEIEARILDR